MEVEQIDESKKFQTLGYVVQIELDARPSKNFMINTLRSITNVIEKSQKKQPHNLVKVLEKSTGFSVVIDFGNEHLASLYQERNPNLLEPCSSNIDCNGH